MATQEFSLKSFIFPLTATKAVHFLILLGILLYGNGLFNSFVGDDTPLILNNPTLHSLSNIPHFFFQNRLEFGKSGFGGSYYRPFLDTTFTFISAFSSSPFLFHLFQMTLFIANTCLVFFFFRFFFRLTTAFILSLLFLVHPMNSEVALYVSNTQEVLFFFFGILSLLFLSHTQPPSPREEPPTTTPDWIMKTIRSEKYVILASLSLLLSLFSKETGVLFLFLSFCFLLILTIPMRRLLIILCSVVLTFYLLLRIHAQGLVPHSLPVSPIERLSLLERALNIPSILLFYLKTSLFPLSLSSSYQWVVQEMDLQHFFLPLLMVGAFFLLLGGSYFFISQKKYQKLLLFFSLWLMIGLLFHSQILPLDQTVAERWFYFPMIGMLGIVGIGLEVSRVNYKKTVVIGAIGLILILFSLRTFMRTFDYRDDFTLAKRDILVSPESHNLEYILSHVYYDEGRLKEAKTHALSSIELFPYVANYTNLGAIESRLENYEAAHDAYTHALGYGEDALPYENLASLALVYGDPKENILFIKETALKKYPQNGKLWFSLALLEYMHGDKEHAKHALQEAKIYAPNPTVSYIESLMNADTPLNIQARHGEVQFITE